MASSSGTCWRGRRPRSPPAPAAAPVCGSRPSPECAATTMRSGCSSCRSSATAPSAPPRRATRSGRRRDFPASPKWGLTGVVMPMTATFTPATVLTMYGANARSAPPAATDGVRREPGELGVGAGLVEVLRGRNCTRGCPPSWRRSPAGSSPASWGRGKRRGGPVAHRAGAGARRWSGRRTRAACPGWCRRSRSARCWGSAGARLADQRGDLGEAARRGTAGDIVDGNRLPCRSVVASTVTVTGWAASRAAAHRRSGIRRRIGLGTHL